MDMPFHIPGTTEPAITMRRSALGSISVLVDGQPAKRRKGRTLSFDIPLADGSVTELALTGRWMGLKAVVNGGRLAVGLMSLPFLITPTDISWAKGDRQISCVVAAPAGGKLTGSVRGTAQ